MDQSVERRLPGLDGLGAAWSFRQADQARHWRGALLDRLGLGPAQTPFRIVHTQAGLRVRRYGTSGTGPAVPLVPAPIKSFYIWDLAPRVSVVQRCLQKGLRVYLAEWVPFEQDGQDYGLADYADRLLSVCLDTIEADCGQERAILIGHSLGGTLAAIFSCLHPPRVSRLVLLEAPLHFAADAGSFAPLVAAAPDAAAIAAMFGTVPGTFLNLATSLAAPAEFLLQRYFDLLACSGNYQALRTHLQVERWTLDEFPMPGQLFTDIVERLYRGDCLMQGRLRIGEREVGPGDLLVPLLSVIDPRSRVIPPRSILPFHHAAAGSPKKLLAYEGDIGVAIQHVGVLVGSNAHVRLWPAIFDWLGESEKLDSDNMSQQE